MKHILVLITLLLFVVSCSKTKTVLICGDHVCINKKEAEQYFEDNLSLEVKIINKKENNKIDLVELNLKSNEKEVKSVSITEKKFTKKTIKVLTNDEIKKKKAELKNKKKIINEENKKKQKLLRNKEEKIVKKKQKKKLKFKKIENNKQKKFVDICLILEDCNIDEISKYLIEQGNKKAFPDITLKE